MSREVCANLLYQHWVHSYEEDTATEKVFRPSAFNFPRSRGRKGFELNSDGTSMDRGIGPTDRPLQTSGTWRIEDDKIAFYQESESLPIQILHIVSVETDRLVIKK